MIKKCPFDDEDFMIPMGTPCPVCGCRGYDIDEIERLCVDGLIDQSKLINADELDKPKSNV